MMAFAPKDCQPTVITKNSRLEEWAKRLGKKVEDLTDEEKAAQEMEKLKGQLEQLVGGTVSVLKSEAIDTNKFMDIQKSERLTDIENEAVTNRALYRIAAGFIRACSGDGE